MTATEGLNSPASPSPAQHSPWHSPLPYLFGGLAAMLGLIAFALLILACSYWKLSSQLESGGDGGTAGNGDIESSGEANSDEKLKHPPVFEEKFLVIMAGQEKPTFLATPISSRASSFGSNGCVGEKTEKSETESEKTKQGSFDQVVIENMESHETSIRIH